MWYKPEREWLELDTKHGHVWYHRHKLLLIFKVNSELGRTLVTVGDWSMGPEGSKRVKVAALLGQTANYSYFY